MADVHLSGGASHVRPALTVGMRADAFVVALVQAIAEIETMRLMSYAVSEGLATRLSEKPGPIDFETKEIEAVIHDTSGRTTHELQRNDLTVERLAALTAALGPRVALALCSNVTLTDGSTAHVPMLDLKCPVSPSNQRLVVELLKRTGRKNGALLDSGNSYHYYGFDLLAERAWTIFLGRSLLFTSLVDTRYVAHRLIDGFCTLRINKTTMKPHIPVVVEWW